MKVYVNYLFIFDPAELWSHLHEFESDLGKFFAEKGVQAEVPAGQMGMKVVMLSKIPMPVVEQQAVQNSDDPKSAQKKLHKEKKLRGYDGRFK